MSAKVLIIDDDRAFRVLATEIVRRQGWQALTAPSLARARMELVRDAPDVVLLDRRLPDGDGLDLLPEIKAAGAPPVIVVTAYSDLDSAVASMRGGAHDYLTKPVHSAELVARIRSVLQTRSLTERLALAERRQRVHPAYLKLPSPQEHALRSQIERLARSPATPVLLFGPSGSGKQVAAQAIHEQSFGSSAPFVDVSCATIPAELFESELFGHEAGAFTDARGPRRGLIEVAEGGTLFLDEVGSLPLAQQPKLLKFLDSFRYRRVGGESERESRVRIVAAGNQDLQKLVAEGRFRADLYHRLSVVTVQIPPLCARKADILPLAENFLAFYADKMGRVLEGFDDSAKAMLQSHDWPGNVRELRNAVERVVILASGPSVTAADLGLEPSSTTGEAAEASAFRVPGTQPTLREVEDAWVRHVLEQFAGRRMLAAQALGISYPTLLRRLRDMGLDEGGQGSP